MDTLKTGVWLVPLGRTEGLGFCWGLGARRGCGRSEGRARAVAGSWASVLSVSACRPPEEKAQVPLVQDLVPEEQKQDPRVSCLAGLQDPRQACWAPGVGTRAA